MDRADSGRGPAGWDTYWQNTRQAAAHRSGGPQEAALGAFWSGVLGQALDRHPDLRLLDLACGNGTVTHQALEAARRSSRPLPRVCGLDRSHPALVQWQRRFAAPWAVVGDAARVPFPDRSFHLVASQFGIEYCGAAAVDEAARLVSSQGSFAAVLHLRGGGIDRECRTNLDAARGVLDSRLLVRSREAFRAAALQTQRGNRARMRRADKQLAEALHRVEQILATHGPQIAGGTLVRLHRDVVQMYRRADAYEPRQVAQWLGRMGRELSAYVERMALMAAAALDESGVAAMAERLAGLGMTVHTREALRVGGEPAAWALVCKRACDDH